MSSHHSVRFGPVWMGLDPEPEWHFKVLVAMKGVFIHSFVHSFIHPCDARYCWFLSGPM